MGKYVAVARSRASAVFYPGDSFSLNYKRIDGEPFTLVFRTQYLEGYEVPVPKNLWVEACGPAKDLHDAAEVFVNAALEISAIISFVANASLGLLELELVFDATSDKEEHEFLQSFVADPPVAVVPGRRIDVEAAGAVLKAIAGHPEQARLQRAILQYVEALQSWRPGHEITCMAHLYMGVEALTKAVLREHMRKIGKPENELVAEWKIDDSDKLQRRKKLESEARRRLIFGGDAECLRKAREVSDTFEHGFGDFGTIRKPAREVIVKTADYLRRAIIDVIDIETNIRERVLGVDYAAPRGPLALVRYIRGKLIGQIDQLAAEDQEYPIMEWRTKLKSVQIGKDGKYGFTLDDTLTVKVGKGVRFQPEIHEVWDGSTIKDLPAEVVEQALKKSE